MTAPFGPPAKPTLAGVDQALAAWRTRLAAASRNVAELSELPEFMALKAARADPAGAPEARRLVATVDELWQGVLLLGEAVGRAEAARAAATRLWMPASLDAVLQILDGPSIGIALGASPVLHRRLLGQAADTAWVSPNRLLETMEAAFDGARTSLARISTARDTQAALRASLIAAVDALAAEGRPEATGLASRLAGCCATDPLTALTQLEALRPDIDAAAFAAAQARAARSRAALALGQARARLAQLADQGVQASQAAAAAAALVAGVALAGPVAQAGELPGWLDRLQRTLDAGRTEAFTLGLASWTALADQVAAGWQGVLDRSAASVALRDELRGRFGALQAKHRARQEGASRNGAHGGQPDPALDAAAAALRAALFGGPADLALARRLLAEYEAALARPQVPAG